MTDAERIEAAKRLVEAAEEMLAALKLALPIVQTAFARNPGTPEYSKAFGAVSIAIAKAEHG